MKQLSVYCSRDLEDRVVAILDHAGVEGCFRTSGAGCRFQSPGHLPRTMEWEATLFVVPALGEAQARRVSDQLELLAGACEVQPCLRVIVSHVERVV